MKVLIADDEKTLTGMLQEILRQSKIDCDIVHNGQDAVDWAKEYEYDVIVLDIMMPKLNGYEALQKIREGKIGTPVLMLSAKGEVKDKVLGLDIGADDYLTKPFNSDELVARIKALSRRKGDFLAKLEVGGITLCPNSYQVGNGKQQIKLSTTEFKILELFFQNKGKVINKERLIEKVWGWDSDAGYNNVEVYISFLRKKLAALSEAVTVKAMRGAGYRLEVAGD